ncbi:MAG: hypothetical protein J7J61_09170 [Candidatus Hydrothermae bacterium]|nr:hypothetical protein [Candidatus Hydrothermae bacterium]
MPKDVLIKIVCIMWPVLRPEIKRIVDDTTTPIDNWVLMVLDELFMQLCKEHAD